MSFQLGVSVEQQKKLIEEAERRGISPEELFEKVITAGMSEVLFWESPQWGEGRGQNFDPSAGSIHKTRFDEVREATTDSLTGLANQRAFLAELSYSLRQSVRLNLPLPLLLLDVDRFKAINDRWGYVEGDQLLIELAGLITRNVAQHDFVARLGGDEFAILTPGRRGTEVADFARALSEAIARESELWRWGRVRVSIGAASFPEDAQTPEHLVLEADEAMYRDKQLARGDAMPEQPSLLDNTRGAANINGHLIGLIDSFEEDDTESQEGEYASLVAGLEAARPGQRRLFGEGFNP